MPAKNQQSKTSEPPSFENAIERLEQLVEQMEGEQLPLEDLLVRHEEGIKLVKICSEKLDAAERKIEIITRDAGGRPRLSEFEPDEKTGQSQSGGVALF